METTQVASLARHLMATHGVSDWALHFNHRKRSLGLCRHDLRQIELSIHFAKANDEPAVRDTILHEIAHARAGRDAGHGPEWKEQCLAVGAKPERCDRLAIMPKGKWRATCPMCGREYSRHRRPLRNRLYSCRHCDPPLGQITFMRTAP